MRTMLKMNLLVLALLTIFSIPNLALGEETKDQPKTSSLTLPNNVLSITKTNTYPNATEEITIVEPSEFTKQLLETVDEPINNPEIMNILNESTVKTTPFSLGYDAHIYLGRWPLYYESESSSIIWDYEHVNTNELHNKSTDESQELTYSQEKERVVKGALMNKIDHPTMIKSLILQHIKSKADFSVAFSTKVGANTKLNELYNVAANKKGTLEAYVPAVNEKGHVIYGDLYIQSKGSQVSLDVKNVTKHGIGAWIPIQDHISLTYTVQ